MFAPFGQRMDYGRFPFIFRAINPRSIVGVAACLLLACSGKTGAANLDAGDLPDADATEARDGMAGPADLPPDTSADSTVVPAEAGATDASDGPIDRVASNDIAAGTDAVDDGSPIEIGEASRDVAEAIDDVVSAEPDAGAEAGRDAAVEVQPGPSNAYFISPAGNDATGDGSALRPWKTISTAVARIDYAHGVPTANLAAGTYDEKVLLRDSIVLQGAGSAQVTIQNSAVGEIDYVITADGSNPTVAGPVAVTLNGIRINGQAAKNRGIRASQAVLTVNDVNIFQPSVYSISIGNNIAGFLIDHTTVGFFGLLYSDVGIDVGDGSSGTISNFVAGDHIDHIINIGLGCTVSIRDTTLTGSTIYYADGIRIQGASNVTIQDTVITRPAGSEPASTGAVHNPPYAGIEIAASSNGNSLVRVDHVTISGFDVGIGINLWYNGALVENSTISGNITADVGTMWTGFLPLQYPVVDLGGGSLGSVGNNNFGAGPESAVSLGGPYDVAALGNTWGATGTAIEARIHDQFDDPTLGRVHY
jgi:Protein of unknown function (DUF1565)